jgi:creatinine amidohydrolase
MAEHHMAFGGTFTFDIPTYRAVLLALLRSLERHGFRRVVIVNGHGGNSAALNAFLPDFARETGLRVLAVSYPDFARKAVATMLQDQPGMLHACEVETSMMLAVAPQLVRTERLSEAHDGETAEMRRAGRRTIARYRSFEERCSSGVWGDARSASREKGEAIVEAIVAAMALRLADRDAEVWH